MSVLIAIVGRPNVGKSALFNRIAGKRIAIVHDEPGVTRDRISVEAEWRGQAFTLVDTGGIGLLSGEKVRDVIAQAALEQVELAIASADVIILVVNVQQGVAPLDQEIAARLRVSGKPLVLAINKADNDRSLSQVPEFAELGLDPMFPVSAAHGLGIEPLMDAACALLPKISPGLALERSSLKSQDDPAHVGKVEGPLKLAVIGRPNVGKSSLINALTQSQRVIVSPMPGTTRDAVDVPFEVHTGGTTERYILIDTAGIRKERRVASSVEFFSVQRAERAIARCDLAILVLDAETGITAQDKQIAGKIVTERKASIVVINKWDLVEGKLKHARRHVSQGKSAPLRRRTSNQEPSNLAEFGRWVQKNLFFLDYAPVVFASAKTGFHRDRFLEVVRFVAAQLKQAIPTAILNRTLHDAIKHRQPVSQSGRHLKFFYATQVRQAPATFLVFVNRAELLSDQYSKYLTNELRRAFGFEGCPIVLAPKSRAKKE